MLEKSGFNKFRSLYFQRSKEPAEITGLRKVDASEKKLFSIFRDDCSWAERNKIYKLFRKNKFREFDFYAFGNLFPKDPKDIIKFPIPKRKSSDIPKLMDSCIYSFHKFDIELSEFLKMRESFEIDFCSKNYENAKITLTGVEKKFGHSLWLIDSARKLGAFNEDNSWNIIIDKFNEKSGFLRAQIASYIDSRGDDKISLISFLSEFNERYKIACTKSDTVESSKVLYSFLRILFLLPSDDLTLEDFEIGFWVCEVLPIVDRYFLVLKYIQLLQIKKKHCKLEIPIEAISPRNNSELNDVFHFFIKPDPTNNNFFIKNNSSIESLIIGENEMAIGDISFREFVIRLFEEQLPYDHFKYHRHLYSTFKSTYVLHYLYDFLIESSQLREIADELKRECNFEELVKKVEDSLSSSRKGILDHIYEKQKLEKLTLNQAIETLELLLKNKLYNLITIIHIKTVLNHWRTTSNYIDLVKFLDALLMANPHLLRFFPIREILKEIEQANISDVKKCVELSLLVNYDERMGLKGIDYERLYRHLDNFLFFLDASKPSDLMDKKIDFKKHHESLLFGDVCVPNVIDSLVELDTPDKVVLERFRLLSYVVGKLNLGGKIYYDEMDFLIKKSILSESFDELSKGKISINESQIKNVLEVKLIRFVDMYNSISPKKTFMSIVGEFIQSQMLEDISESNDNIVIKNIPVRSIIFENLYKIIADSYLNNPHFGLDSCLSVRVRHTVFKSFFKGMFSKHHLISTGGDEDLVLDRDYWEKVCKQNNAENALVHILKGLDDFRSSVEAYMNNIKNKVLHINSSENKEGLFDFSFRRDEILFINNSLSKNYDTVTVEQVFDEVFQSLNKRLLENLSSLNGFFKNTVANDIRYELSKLEKNIKGVDIDNILVSNIGKCKAEIDLYMEEVSNWFQLEDEDYFSDFYLEDLLENYKLLYERLIPGLNLNIKIMENGGRQKVLFGRHKGKIVDIYNNIFTNVVNRSGQSLSNCQIFLSFKYEENEVCVEIKNPCKTEEIEKIKQNIQKVKNDSKDEKEMIKKLRSEGGGTGLMKIKNILTNISKDSSLDYSLMGAEFVLNLKLCGLGVFRE